MYVSNENATLVDVYFDDIVMTHTKGNVVQYNEYYPFGLQTANSWTRENNTGNNFLANGGTELNTTSNLYDLQYRNYDPILGRMNQVDPMATKYASLTPYNFAFNDPVYYNDISGADPNQDSGLKEWMRESNARSDRDFNNFFNPNYMYGIVGDDDLKNPNRFGAGYLPGEFDGSGRLGQEYNVYERWEDTYTNGRLTDSKFIGLRFEEKYSKRDQTQGDPSPWQVGWEWLTGDGPRHRDFTNGDEFTELLRQHSHIEDTRGLIRDGSLKGSNPYSLKGVDGIGKYLKDYSTLLTGGATGNLAVTYLGSYNLTYEVTAVSGNIATVLFEVNNSSNMGSATHLPYFGYLPGWNANVATPLNNIFSSGALSPTTQTFRWTENIKLK